MRTSAAQLLCILLLGLWCVGLQTPAEARGHISERTYKQLETVHALMDEGRHDQALARLEAIRTSQTRPYEQALVLHTYAYLYAAKEQYPQAIEAFERCLTLGVLPQSATKNALYALAQLRMATADYQAAVVNLEKWFALEKKPTPQAHALAGSAYTQVKRYVAAIKHFKRALALATEPKELWYRQLVAVYYEAKRYPAAAGLLEEMIERFPPRKDYWLQLSGIYQTLNNDQKALAVMELAYQRGLLTHERELLNLVRYYLHMELPYQAGQLLGKALQDGPVRSTGQHWKLLSDTWLRARELPMALVALEQALELTPSAALHLRRAQLAVEIEDWPLVLQAVDTALAMQGLERPGTAYLLRGIAYYHLEQDSAALVAFARAKDFEYSRSQAEQWINYVTIYAHESAGLALQDRGQPGSRRRAEPGPLVQ